MNIKIGDKCICCQGKIGIVNKIKNGIYFGKTLDNKNWQSKRPKKV